MRIVVVGEGMIELSRRGRDWRLGHGGDALNIAIHLARLGRDVALLTALGSDPFSAELRAAWAGEGVDPSLVLTDPDRVAGLYAIRTDAHGERSFTYWRDGSAARRTFELPDSACAVERAAGADLLVLSLISLAVLPPAGRAALIALCTRVRARGGRVAFDGNYRPRLWDDAGTARRWRDAVLTHCDIGLPTLEDEEGLGSAPDAAAIAAAWRERGAGEVVVKLGARGCLTDAGLVAPPSALQPVDTSGAGDAFDAGYLDARIAGAEVVAAAAAGHALAGWTVMREGAIPRIDAAAPYPR